MNGLQPTSSLTNGIFSPIETCKNYICTNSLIGRVSANWKVLLMDCSTILSITCFVISFLTGSTLVCSAFFLLSIASGISAFYMRQFSILPELANTAKDLRETKEKFDNIAASLRNENSRLSAANRDLTKNNTLFRENNQNLTQTNARLNQQVTQLTLQVTGLRESAEKIRSEMVRFQQENGHLHAHVSGFNESLRTLDGQILSSRALCEQIVGHLSSQHQELGEQLGQLGRYLSDLRADNRVHERIQELGTLQDQVKQATEQLHQIQLQYAAERANFQAIHEALVQLRSQFDLAIRDASSNMQANNQQFRTNLNELGAERQRIHDLINRHFPGGSSSAQGNRSH